MIQNYELYLIFNPELASAQVTENHEELLKLLGAELNAQNVQLNSEGLKKLAYPVQAHKTGFYTLITFDANISDIKNMSKIERKLNLNDSVIRYIIVNQTDFLKQKSKEKLNQVEIVSHRELNKSRTTEKKCISRYLGLRALDYKDTEYLNQFTSPYAKIFHRKKTGSSSKFQRKITQAIKRARHMALMPFTPIHYS